MSSAQKVIKVVAIALAVFIIVNIFSLIFSGLSMLLDIDFGSDGGNISFEEVYQDIREIEIDGASANVEITSGDEFKVEAKDLDNELTSKVRNGVLKIEENDKWFSGSNKGVIYITVPEGTVLGELSIDMGAGKFKIHDIEVKEFDMDHGAGVLEIDNVKFNSSDIDGGAGTIKIKKSNLNNLDLDAGAGKVEVEASITGKSQISCGVGEVDITLIGNEDDYQIKIEKGIGNVSINGTKQESSTTYGSGINKLDIEGGIGNIKVSFE